MCLKVISLLKTKQNKEDLKIPLVKLRRLEMNVSVSILSFLCLNISNVSQRIRYCNPSTPVPFTHLYSPTNGPKTHTFTPKSKE